MTGALAGLAAVNQNNPALGMILTFIGSIGIGGTIQPAVTMMTIISPDESIATITAASISIRLIGATVGYAVFFNILQEKLLQLPAAIKEAAIAAGLPPIQSLALVVAVLSNNVTALENFPTQIVEVAEAAEINGYLAGFKLVYLVSIVFGGSAIIASCFLKDIKDYMVDRVAVEIQ